MGAGWRGEVGGWAARGAGAISSLLFIRKKGGGEEEEVTHRLSVLFISKKRHGLLSVHSSGAV